MVLLQKNSIQALPPPPVGEGCIVLNIISAEFTFYQIAQLGNYIKLSQYVNN